MWASTSSVNGETASAASSARRSISASIADGENPNDSTRPRLRHRLFSTGR